MQKFVEGNPALTDEQPEVLREGALVYHRNSNSPSIDVILSACPALDRPSMFGLTDDFDESWARIEKSLDQTVNLGLYPSRAMDTCDLIRTVRRYIEGNAIYEEIRKEGQQVRLCIRHTHLNAMITQEVAPGITVKFAKPTWHIEIIKDEANAYPKPEHYAG